MNSQLETTFTEEVRAKATAYLEELWQDYKVAARAYTELFEDKPFDFGNKEEAYKSCIELNQRFEDAKRAYHLIGLTNLGIHGTIRN